MTTVVPMPTLAEGMLEGTLVSWLVEDGTPVEAGQEIAEIETDKATVVYTAEAAGRLRQIVSTGTTVAIGEPIAELAGPGDATQPAPPGRQRSRLSASPVARRMATQYGIDLAVLPGSGPGGRIVRADVQSALDGTRRADSSIPAAGPAPLAPARPNGPRAELSHSQQTVARRMSRSKTEAPEFHVTARADIGECQALRSQWRDADLDGPLPSLNDLIVKAAALALRHHPRANAHYVDDAIRLFDTVNVGIAAAAEDDLVVPVITAADVKPLRTIAAETRSLLDRARGGSLAPADVSGATFTISNLGMFGVESFEAILNPPQVAILAVGSAVDTVVPRDGEIAVRPLMTLTLVCDHRALYGAHAAALLQEIRTNLEKPVRLLA
jgi:pyruvate dehydrogenase E2 component (dihydrolipoamide acetyltransferase)